MNGRKPIKDYRDLDVWNETMSLAAEIYEMTRPFPREEMSGMTLQLRRASVSVAANIAEGYGRQQTRPFMQFPRVSQDSLKKVGGEGGPAVNPAASIRHSPFTIHLAVCGAAA